MSISRVRWGVVFARSTPLLVFGMISFATGYIALDIARSGRVVGALAAGWPFVAAAVFTLAYLIRWLDDVGSIAWDQRAVWRISGLRRWRMEWADLGDATIHRSMEGGPQLVLTSSAGRRMRLDFDLLDHEAHSLLKMAMAQAAPHLEARAERWNEAGYVGRPDCLLLYIAPTMGLMLCLTVGPGSGERAGSTTTADVAAIGAITVAALAGIVALVAAALRTVRIDDTGVTATGALRSTWLPWPAIRDVESRWLEGRGGTIAYQSVKLKGLTGSIRLTSRLRDWGVLAPYLSAHLPSAVAAGVTHDGPYGRNLWNQVQQLMPHLPPGNAPRHSQVGLTRSAGPLELAAFCGGWLALLWALSVGLMGHEAAAALRSVEAHAGHASAVVLPTEHFAGRMWGVEYRFSLPDGSGQSGFAVFASGSPLPPAGASLPVLYDLRDPDNSVSEQRFRESGREVAQWQRLAGRLGVAGALLLSVYLLLAHRRRTALATECRLGQCAA